MIERVNTKTRQAGNFEREISFKIFLISFALFIVHDVIHHAMHKLVIHRIHIDSTHIAINTDHRRQTGRQVKVRCAILDSKGQQLRNIHFIP